MTFWGIDSPEDGPPLPGPAFVAAHPGLFQAAGIGLLAFNGSGRPVWLNAAASRWLGFGGQAPSLARLLAVLFPARDRRALFIRGLRQVLAGSGPGRMEFVGGPAPGGGWLMSLCGAVSEDGRPAGGLLAIADVGGLGAETERLAAYARHLEETVEHRSRDLVRAEKKYREAYDSSPDMYLTIDRAGRIREINRTALRATSHRREEVVGRRVLRFVSPEGRRQLRTAWHAFQEAGQIENLEIRLCRADGEEIDAIANAAAIHDEDGVADGARILLRDITRRNLLERQLRQADRLAATGRLAAGVAHEINNPLQAILTHLAIVESRLPPGFPERESWERIKTGVGRIRQIVSDLLDIPRGAQHGKEKVDVNRVGEEVLGLCQVPLRQRGIRQVREFALHLPQVVALERHLYQIILNLVLNAMEAMPHGGTLTVRTRVAGGQGVEIDVADTGSGIPEKLLPHIFEPFLTAGDHRGTGLGLFVCYGLVREHGGRIQVDSIPGRGTTFRVFLPVGENPAGVPDPSARAISP